jgi:hypothetical protein
MSDDTINAICFTLMLLLLIVYCAGALLSLILLISAAESGMGLKPWIAVLLTSLAGVLITARQVGR